MIDVHDIWVVSALQELERYRKESERRSRELGKQRTHRITRK